MKRHHKWGSDGPTKALVVAKARSRSVQVHQLRMQSLGDVRKPPANEANGIQIAASRCGNRKPRHEYIVDGLAGGGRFNGIRHDFDLAIQALQTTREPLNVPFFAADARPIQRAPQQYSHHFSVGQA